MSTPRLAELAIVHLDNWERRLGEALAPLSESQIWWRPNAAGNSIGNLLLHLAGNLRQWIVGGLGGGSLERRRGDEFRAQGGLNKAELWALFSEVVADCRRVAAALDEEALTRRYAVQGYDFDGHATLFHPLEHLSYHAGQIVLLAKALAPRAGLDFYPQHAGE